MEALSENAVVVVTLAVGGDSGPCIGRFISEMVAVFVLTLSSGVGDGGQPWYPNDALPELRIDDDICFVGPVVEMMHIIIQ